MLTPELIKKIRRIEIRTRRLVNDSFAGEYHAIFKGRGMEFDEVRPYQPGDEVRDIDWNVTARTGDLFVKRFVEERELRFQRPERWCSPHRPNALRAKPARC